MGKVQDSSDTPHTLKASLLVCFAGLLETVDSHLQISPSVYAITVKAVKEQPLMVETMTCFGKPSLELRFLFGKFHRE